MAFRINKRLLALITAVISSLLFFIIGGGKPGNTPQSASGYTISSCIDGDSLRVMTNGKEETVRLKYIDAMEAGNNEKLKRDLDELRKDNPGITAGELITAGRAAADYLKRLLPGGTPVLLTGTTRDRYGRLLAEISVNGTNINLHLVQTGHARAYFVGSVSRDIRDRYTAAMNGAVTGRLGIWKVMRQP